MLDADPRQTLGKTGEGAACAELVRRGYAILARRYRTRLGELDIVARDGHTLVFVEVKARRSERYGRATEAVTPLKQRRLRRMAMDFILRTRLDRVPCRFDVVSVDVADRGRLVVEVYRDAF